MLGLLAALRNPTLLRVARPSVVTRSVDVMRILTVCTSTNVFGAEVVTLKMLDGFQRAGHEQLAITSIWTDGEFNRRLARLGIPEVRLPFGALSRRLAPQPMWWTINTLVRLPWLWIGWSRLVRRFKPDVIILTSPRHAVVLYPFTGTKPSFLIEFTYLEPTRTRQVLYRVLARKVAGFIAVSEFMRKHTIKIGAPPEKVLVVKSAVFSVADKPRVEEECSRFPISIAGRLRVGIIGQISPHKGHGCLVDAIQLLGGKRCALDIYIFGTGDPKYISYLKERLTQLGLGNSFHWMGYETDTPRIYRDLDICVVPSSLGDPFPTVAMEAGAYGRPVIASRAGGLPEIVEHGLTGWLVEPNNPKDLAERIQGFIESPAAIEKMGKAARSRIFSQFTQEKMVRELEEIFRDVTPKHKKFCPAMHPNSSAV